MAAKKKLKLKKDITLDIKIDIIEKIAEFIIGDGENRNAKFMPYIYDYAFIVAVAQYAVDNFKLDEYEDFSKITSDKSVLAVVNEFKEKYADDVDFIYKNVWDIVDYRKQKLLSPTHGLETKLLEILDTQKAFEDLRLTVLENENKVLKQQIKANEYQEEIYSKMTPEETAKLNKMMLEDGFDVNKIADIMMEKYIASDAFNTNKDSIIESKNAEIRNLQKCKLAHEARNVIADK